MSRMISGMSSLLMFVPHLQEDGRHPAHAEPPEPPQPCRFVARPAAACVFTAWSSVEDPVARAQGLPAEETEPEALDAHGLRAHRAEAGGRLQAPTAACELPSRLI